MSYTSEIENLINTQGYNQLIFANKFLQERFSLVPEFSYYKIIERMTKAGKLARIAKGIYCVPKKTKYGKVLPSEEEIITAFIGENNNEGILVGYQLYNSLKLTTQISKTFKLYSTLIEEQTKVVGNIIIKKIDLTLSDEVIEVIKMLEVLQNYNNIQELNKNNFISYCETFAKNYNEKATKYVLKNIKYKKSTIAFLQNILKYFNLNNTLKNYLSALSDYNIPSMEAINDTASI